MKIYLAGNHAKCSPRLYVALRVARYRLLSFMKLDPVEIDSWLDKVRKGKKV